MSFLSKNKFKNWKKKFPEQKYMIEEAFSIGGQKYYQFTDVFNLPVERGLTALMVYEETRMKCSVEYLQKHIEATRKILRSDKIDIFRINQLNEQLNERVNFALDIDLIYKLASVVYFDENENPSLYDGEYCREKIGFWKKNKEVADFFLQQPLTELLPYLKNADFNLNEYSTANGELNRIHSERLSM
ncbi:MAG: hypothetical protein FWF53_06950 [Candidatus Azobacteroides sp.]|nr:hypothetical protein [Candidatus Azobacteroides sp.]